jgi:hypothetical protein
MAMTTRTKAVCVVFGAPQCLPDNVLPRYTDVMKAYHETQQQLMTSSKKYPTFIDVSKVVCKQVEEIWEKASLPTVSHPHVIDILRNYHGKYRTLLKPYKAKKGKDKYEKQLQQFRNDANKLFDISKCKCIDIVASCKCERHDKVPANEREFLQDQRGRRMMIIGGIDEKETSKLQEKLAREENGIKRRKKEMAIAMCKAETQALAQSEDDAETDDNSDAVDEYTPRSERPSKPAAETSQSKRQMTVHLPSLAQACDRTGVSDRSAAIIASSVLKDLGIVSPADSSKVIDKCKIQRERIKARVELQRSKANVIEGLYFDGRKDKTMNVVHDMDNKYHRNTSVEEHISIIAEPGSKYFSHATPSSGSSKSITEAILSSLELNDVSANNVKAIGCDGTAVNTGHNGGVIRQLEESVGHPLQWIVCLLHANELPLRHLFQHLDGSTTGPRGFSGPIGNALSLCIDKPIVAFQPICLKEQLPSVDVRDLSTDQQYLRLMCEAVNSGDCPLELAMRNPGLLNHSRWLTTANRILRVYVSTDEPSQKLIDLVTFIMLVYVPMWFLIKSKPSCKDGARHMHEMIRKSRYLSHELKEIVDPVLKRNAFFAHPENMLLAMITDDRPHIRELGLRRILKARSTQATDKTIRRFRVPELNMNAESDTYEDMINWAETVVTQPPVMMTITDDELRGLIAADVTPEIHFARLPCHTQAVERCVKLVTEASAAVCGEKSRDGFIRSRVASRQMMPMFKSKCDFPL